MFIDSILMHSFTTATLTLQLHYLIPPINDLAIWFKIIPTALYITHTTLHMYEILYSVFLLGDTYNYLLVLVILCML